MSTYTITKWPDPGEGDLPTAEHDAVPVLWCVEHNSRFPQSGYEQIDSECIQFWGIDNHHMNVPENYDETSPAVLPCRLEEPQQVYRIKETT